MTTFHVQVRHRRARKALAGASVVLGALLAGFFNLQLAESPVYAVEARSHRSLPLRVEAPRGVILDRHGAALADNVTAHALSLLPVPADTAILTLTRLAPRLGLSPEQVAELAARKRRDPHRPLVLVGDIPTELVEYLEAEARSFPGLLVESRPERRYPGGTATAHLLAGVEAAYEHRLRGMEGLRFIEVDQVGRLVGSLAHRLTRAPRSGETLALHIDLALQRGVAGLIPEGVSAAVVALAPATGAVLAIYSSPDFDPHDPPSARPPDRGLGMVYRAGHLWQVVTAATALRYGIVEPEARLPLPCRGGMRYGDRYMPCWERGGHGALDLAGALRHSCEVYFYQLGLKIGLDRLIAEGTRLGFGALTGVDLPGERVGSLTPAVWEANDAPVTSEELGMRVAAGDAGVTVSPLRMAHFFAAVATAGGTPVPRVVASAADPAGSPSGPGLKLDATAREALYQGLLWPAPPSGSGSAQLDGLVWSGKLGAAAGPGGPEWFVGIAGPAGWPAEIVVAVVIDQAASGVDAAAVAWRAAEIYRRQPVPSAGGGTGR